VSVDPSFCVSGNPRYTITSHPTTDDLQPFQTVPEKVGIKMAIMSEDAMNPTDQEATPETAEETTDETAAPAPVTDGGDKAEEGASGEETTE